MKLKMTVFCGIVLLLAAGLVQGGDAKKDKEKLQGTWTFEKDGKKIELKIKGDGFVFTQEDEIKAKGTFKLDASKKPREIDMTVTKDSKDKSAAKTSKGIYEIEGDTFKWCANEPGKEDRPKEFAETTGDAKHLLASFKRVK